MNHKLYDICCIITSFIMLLILIINYKKIDICSIFILSAVLSILWRSQRLLFQKDTNSNSNSNSKYSFNKILFLLDFIFAVLSIICLFLNNKISNKHVFITLFIFIIAWFMYIINVDDISKNIHLLGHVYVIIIFIYYILIINKKKLTKI
jgi:hypothetical protein